MKLRTKFASPKSYVSLAILMVASASVAKSVQSQGYNYMQDDEAIISSKHGESQRIRSPSVPAIIQIPTSIPASNVPINRGRSVARVAVQQHQVPQRIQPSTVINHQQAAVDHSPIDHEAAPAVTRPVTNELPPQQIIRSASVQQLTAASIQQDEPVMAPSFEHVVTKGCPPKGVFSYENRDHCDRYFMCTNGTFTEEACPNGLAYSQMGAVYQHCAYNWNVHCGMKKTSEPLASPGCPWQFGIFPATTGGRCNIDYFVCEWGVPETKRCTPEGLFYDDRIKGCQWADQLGCKSENLLNFKCPPEDEDNPYWPYPRYYHTKQDVIVCVNEQPRLVHCNEEQYVDPSSLACLDLKKKKKI